MAEQQKNELIVHILTHGPQKKSGNTPETYDGPLLPESRKALEGIELPDYEVAYCGQMVRHLETAEVVGVQAETVEAVGNDKHMFAALDGDNTAVVIFGDFIEKLKADGIKSVLLITSRFYPVLFQYVSRGGAEKFGPFGTYCNIIEDAAAWDGNQIPLMVSGVVSTFKV